MTWGKKHFFELFLGGVLTLYTIYQYIYIYCIYTHQTCLLPLSQGTIGLLRVAAGGGDTDMSGETEHLEWRELRLDFEGAFSSRLNTSTERGFDLAAAVLDITGKIWKVLVQFEVGFPDGRELSTGDTHGQTANRNHGSEKSSAGLFILW